MICDTPLFDILRRELVAGLKEHHDDIEAEHIATRILENDGDGFLTIGLTDGAQAVVTYNRLSNSVLKTLILSDGIDGNG